jgi:hypothetical protein
LSGILELLDMPQRRHLRLDLLEHPILCVPVDPCGAQLFLDGRKQAIELGKLGRGRRVAEIGLGQLLAPARKASQFMNIADSDIAELEDHFLLAGAIAADAIAKSGNPRLVRNHRLLELPVSNAIKLLYGASTIG